MKTKITLISALVLSGIILIQCGGDQKPVEQETPVTGNIIVPVDLPTNIVPGFNFPESESTVLSWLSSTPFDETSIYAHAWGIWAGLTAQSGQVYQGDSLRIFETWLGITEIQTMISDTGLKTVQQSDLNEAKKSRTPLKLPSQLGHNKQVSETIDSSFSSGGNLFVSVSYNNPAATFAISNAILKQEVLNTYYKPGEIGAIPVFPNDAITLKPTYFAAKPQGNLIRIPVWPGEPQAPQAFSFSQWDNYIYADTTNSQQPGKSLKPVAGSETNPDSIAGATCNLSDFIYFEMDAAMAAYVNTEQSSQGANFVGGDMAILVCMHVATKEISNWTWQTFYWDPNPSQPKFPGTNLAKPSQITGAPAHYSVSTAYSMLAPNQPITGGTNDQLYMPVFGYNPYLEAGFSPVTFDSVANNFHSEYVYGMQTNCMSCHAMANYSPNVSLGAQDSFPLYTTNQYIDMSDARFKSRVQLDFAWSIIANMIPTASSTADPKQ